MSDKIRSLLDLFERLRKAADSQYSHDLAAIGIKEVQAMLHAEQSPAPVNKEPSEEDDLHRYWKERSRLAEEYVSHLLPASGRDGINAFLNWHNFASNDPPPSPPGEEQTEQR